MVVPNFTKGSRVEVSSDDPGFHGAWYVATFMDEVELHQSKSKGSKKGKKIGYRVTYVSIAEEANLSKRLTEIVDPSFVRPLPPRYPRRNTNNDQADYYEVFDVVDAYLLDGWWMGVVTKVINNGNKYMVSFEYPPEEVEFRRSKLRLHVDWIDGRWQVPPKKTLEQESQESAITNAEHQDSVLLEQRMSIKETCEAEAGKSRRKRKRGRPSKSLIAMPNGLLQDIQESGKTMSSAILEMTTGVDEQPLSTWYQGVLKKTRCPRRSALDHGDEPSDALDLAIVNNPEMTEYQQEWPFIKRSPIWATFESLELYQNPPQKPHFSLLKEAKEDRREGLAIGHMVTFANVVQRTSELKLDDPNDMIENSLEILVELETNGFDVGAVRARLNELVSKKAQVGELKDKLKQIKEELQERNLEMSEIDDELGELEGKMQDLKEKLAESAKKRKVKNEEIKTLQSNLCLFGNQIMDLEGYF